MHLKFSSDIVGTTGNNGAVAVLVDVIYSYKAEFEDHAGATESVAMQTAIETGSLIDEVLAWLWVF